MDSEAPMRNWVVAARLKVEAKDDHCLVQTWPTVSATGPDRKNLSRTRRNIKIKKC